MNLPRPARPTAPVGADVQRADIERLANATGRLDTAVQEVLDRGGADAFAAPSLLPGWTIGHVVTHLARNADGLQRVLVGATVGEQLQPYTSPQARDDDIEQGARRGTDAIAIDFRTSAERLAETISALPQPVWAATVDLGRGGPATADVIVATRLAEVELHHHDLGADPGLQLLDDDQAAALLAAILRSYARTRGVQGFVLLPDGGKPITLGEVTDAVPSTVAGPALELVGWLSGRMDGASLRTSKGLPQLPGW